MSDKKKASSHSDNTWPVPRKSSSDPNSHVSTTSLPRSRDANSRIPNIAFVLDLLEKATAHGSLSNAEALSAFDHWLSERTESSSSEDSVSLRSVGQYLHHSVTSTVSGDTRLSRSVSTGPTERTSTSDPVLNSKDLIVSNRKLPRPNWLKGFSRLFAACGTTTASSPPTEYSIPPRMTVSDGPSLDYHSGGSSSCDRPISEQLLGQSCDRSITRLCRALSVERPVSDVTRGLPNDNSSLKLSRGQVVERPISDVTRGPPNDGLATKLSRGQSFERPLPEPPFSADEPIYAQYDPLGRIAHTKDADCDSIYDEADECLLEDAYETLNPECEKEEVRRVDSGMSSSHSDIA